MRLISLCHICGAPATNTCSNCGRAVCREDFDFRMTVCRACLSKRLESKGEDETETPLF